MFCIAVLYGCAGRLTAQTVGPDSDGRKYHLGQLHSFKASGAGVGGIRGRVCRGVWARVIICQI
jgi:hypothetical protein